MQKIEIIKDPSKNFHFTNALFDFDGTISLIREGWQQVMIPYFCEVLEDAPIKEDKAKTEKIVTEFVDRLTGKQTIFQCMALCDEVARRGGKPETPKYYKDEYLRRLMEKIHDRREGLRAGTINKDDLCVTGAREFLTLLKNRGVKMFVASGTDEPQVKEEVELLGFTEFFEGRIYGAKDAAVDCSKELVIKELLESDNFNGKELVAFGDGYVEIELANNAGGYGVAVATDEKHPGNLDEHKRQKLLRAGAGMCIADFSEPEKIIAAFGNAL